MNSTPSTGETVVAEPGLLLMWIGFPLLGAGAGWLLQAVAGWVASIPFVPFRGPLRFIDSLSDHEPAATLVSLAVGLLVGLVIAAGGAHEHLTVTVSDKGVALRRGGKTRRFERDAVSGAFLDDSYLVLLDRDTGELVRQSTHLHADPLRSAFLAHDLPWTDDDPHRERYRRWVEGLPELSGTLDALFRARDRALERGDEDDAEQLRGELARLGIVVRAKGSPQFWRQTRPAADGPGTGDRG
ncbi:hypothetical protein AQ490_03990 [Wenjunlia vitaminophila]|uniref:Uncharacterized protein n=2 Tax=Wenjunlia vitaminophila TaxID=76728 RepID=A0A0T6LR04_WENVI|nr:hypothetical protein AQ490_03990 [Wenjunlia vitaminophila]